MLSLRPRWRSRCVRNQAGSCCGSSHQFQCQVLWVLGEGEAICQWFVAADSHASRTLGMRLKPCYSYGSSRLALVLRGRLKLVPQWREVCEAMSLLWFFTSVSVSAVSGPSHECEARCVNVECGVSPVGANDGVVQGLTCQDSSACEATSSVVCYPESESQKKIALEIRHHALQCHTEDHQHQVRNPASPQALT